VFSQYGIPETIVSDNAACFTGEEFKVFTTVNGIKHITLAPHHPASNGLADEAVQIVNQDSGKQRRYNDTKLAKILFAYCLTPHTTISVLPSELLINRSHDVG